MSEQHTQKGILFIAVAAALIGIVWAFSSVFHFGNEVARVTGDVSDYIEDGHRYMRLEYNINAAKDAYEKVLTFDSENKMALYSLARIYSIVGDYDDAIAVIDLYKDLYPTDDRIHYVAGLAYGFKGDLNKAQNEFEAFISSDIAEWQGYLDLAWVNFRQGDFDDAEENLLMAIDTYGDNVWLNTSLGAVYVAKGENERAAAVLGAAREQVDVLTKEEWANNYSYNDPEKFDAEIAQMKNIIDVNIALAEESGSTIGVAQALNSSFVGISPNGFTDGVVVAACGASDSCSTMSCFSQPNACGQVGQGSYQSCTISGDTACNAQTPSNPSGYGNTCYATNACGNTSSGTIGCDGLCGATPPEGGSCDALAPSVSSGVCTVGELRAFNIVATHPDGENVRYGIDWNNDGVVDQYSPTEGYTSPGSVQTVGNVFSTEGVKTIRVRTEDESGDNSVFISHTFVCNEGEESALLGGDDGEGGGGEGGVDGALVATPLIVQSGESTTLLWDTSGVESCTVTGTNGDLFNGTSSTVSSGAITEQTIFTLNCDDGTVTDSVTVNVVPVFQEI